VRLKYKLGKVVISKSVEDYLKTIYGISQENGSRIASTSAIAERLGVSPASVTEMFKKLNNFQPKLINYQPYRGVVLTPEGEKIAIGMLRHHRLLMCFLSQTLGYDWHELHDEADQLEHFISENFEKRVAESLGYPKTDPFGGQIPARDGTVNIIHEKPLSELAVGDKVSISRVSYHDPDLLQHLKNLGLTPRAQIEIIDRGPFDDPMHIHVQNTQKTHALNKYVTNQVFTQMLETPIREEAKSE
jgi:DtxR family Mn-dependent transcriptional regulator